MERMVMVASLVASLLCLVKGIGMSVAPAPENAFLLAGQSNMAGRGGVQNITASQQVWDGFVPPECRPNKRIVQLDSNLLWVRAREPLHREIDPNRTNGVGPGMAFSHFVLAERPEYGIVGLVPCAYGGSKISDWQRGSYLYSRMVERAKASTNRGGRLRALLWFQGGADSDTREDADKYQLRLLKFFNNFREDVHLPELPIVQVAIAPGRKLFSDRVRQAQLSLRLPYLVTVDSNGLPVGPDHVHLTTPSQVKLGRILADAYFQLI